MHAVDSKRFRLLRRQHGVAAIEFVFVASILIVILMGMASYWRVLQTQQSLSRATGDAARLVQNMLYASELISDSSSWAEFKEEAEREVVSLMSEALMASGLAVYDENHDGEVEQSKPLVEVDLSRDGECSDESCSLALSVAYKIPNMFGGVGKKDDGEEDGGEAPSEEDSERVPDAGLWSFISAQPASLRSTAVISYARHVPESGGRL